MLIIGLTGGIGSGKTTVASMFSELGIPVLDADEIGRELVKPGSVCLRMISQAFGTRVLSEDGSIDRTRLRDIVFNDELARKQLESILHPPILEEMIRRTERLESPYCVLCIPLLLETEQKNLVQRVLVVDTPEELQRLRVLRRDGLSKAQLAAIMRAQASREARLSAADDIISNEGNIVELEQQVKQLHRKYLKLAAQLTRPTAPD